MMLSLEHSILHKLYSPVLLENNPEDKFHVLFTGRLEKDKKRQHTVDSVRISRVFRKCFSFIVINSVALVSSCFKKNKKVG